MRFIILSEYNDLFIFFFYSFLDIWSIADFAIPGFLGSKMDFTSEFEIKNTDSDDEITEKGKDKQESIILEMK